MELSKEELQPFNPKLRKHRFKLWVRVVTSGYSYHHVYWRRIASVVALLLVTGWLAAAAAVWTFLRYQREYHGARYVDLVFYPWRKEEFRTGLARHYLALGHSAVQRQDYRRGYALLMAGLRRVPGDFAARRQVAVMQVRFGLVHRALDTLAEGLPYQPDLDYLKLLFGWLFEAKEDERVVALAQKLLPAKPDANLQHRFIALQAATAHYQRGRYAEAERLVGDWGLTNSLEGQIVLAKCDHERGFTDRALQRLEGELGRFGKRDELYLELVRLRRAQGQWDEARRMALLRQFNDPHSPGPRIDLLYAYHQSDDKPALEREIGTYLAQFRADVRALDELAWFGATTHQTTVIDRAREAARSQELPLLNITIAQVQEALEREAYPAALGHLETATAEKDSYQAHLLEGMRAVALYGIRDAEGGHRAVINFTSNARLRASDAVLFARHLRQLGAAPEARALLERATTLDPLNELALAELVRLDAETGNRAALGEHLPRLLKVRKPPRQVLEEILLKLGPEDAELARQVRDALARSSRGTG